MMRPVFLVLACLHSVRTAAAQDVDSTQAAVIGTWSAVGECDEHRYVFTPEGHYVWLRSSENGWGVAYSGVYLVRLVAFDSAIAEETRLTLGPNMATDAVIDYGILSAGPDTLSLVEYEEVVGPDGPEGLASTGEMLMWQRCTAE
jgi:hypothetical protein